MLLPFDSPDDYVHLVAPPSVLEDGLVLVFRGDQLLVEVGPVITEGPEGLAASVAPTAPADSPTKTRPSWMRVPVGRAELGLPLQVLGDGGVVPLRVLYIGTLGGRPCYAVEVALEHPAPTGMAWQGLRTLFTVLSDAHLALAGRALQLIDWDRTHRFCGRCGTPTAAKATERARVCPSCKLTVYPRISPAIMALVCRGRELLLGRSPHFAKGVFSALAGFIEPGETLEQGLAREVREESGAEVTNIRYFASQPWPFPNSLMIAFVCDWVRGDLHPQEGEMEAVEWFDVARLPKLPSEISIARRLIETVAANLR